MKKLLLLSFLGTFLSPGANAQKYVDANAVGLNNGTSWANAYNDLSGAIYNSTAGDTIWVKEGTYYPAHDTTGSVPSAAFRSFWLKNGLVVYGGFVGTETNLSQRDPINHKAILNGEFTPTAFANHVIFIYSNINSSAVMDGFIVTGGNAVMGSTVEHGGGMLLYGDASFYNMEFRFNFAYQHGGAVYSNNSESKFVNCRFRSNTCSQYDGGAVNFNFSNIEMYNCVFQGNAAGRFGAAFTSVISDTKLQNCTFVGNSGPHNVFQHSVSGTLKIYNSVFDSNTTPAPVSASSTMDFKDGLVPDAAWSTWCPTCMIATPIFINAAAGNFGLTASSPGVDETLTGTYTNPYADIAGNPRLVGTSMDMGAYEYQGSVGIVENSIETNFQLFPNPTSGNLTVLSNEKIMDIHIFNIAGELVQTAGTATFSVAALSPGMYTIAVKTEKGLSVNKFIKQ